MIHDLKRRSLLIACDMGDDLGRKITVFEAIGALFAGRSIRRIIGEFDEEHGVSKASHLTHGDHSNLTTILV